MIKLQQIDALSRGDHHFLEDNDECYFMRSYASHRGYTHSDDNQLIFNLKKDVSKRGTPEYYYKNQAIKTISDDLKSIDLAYVFGSDFTVVPIPPSKIKEDGEYDDRLMRILSMTPELDVKELILQKENTRKSHESEGNRLTIEELVSNYQINPDKMQQITKETIVLFDDILTTGTHFAATKNFILNHFSDKKIIGLFIARCVFEKPSEETTDLDLDLLIASLNLS